MKAIRKTIKRLAGSAIYLVRKVWLVTVLLILAIALFGAGIYFKTSPEPVNKSFWGIYNQGVLSSLPEGKEKMQSLLAYVASASENKKLRSLAFYNLGTALGREAEAKEIDNSKRLDMINMAIGSLEEAIRNDPFNEDAKINREILRSRQRKVMSEMAASQESGGKPSQRPGYSPGSGGGKGY